MPRSFLVRKSPDKIHSVAHAQLDSTKVDGVVVTCDRRMLYSAVEDSPVTSKDDRKSSDICEYSWSNSTGESVAAAELTEFKSITTTSPLTSAVFGAETCWLESTLPLEQRRLIPALRSLSAPYWDAIASPTPLDLVVRRAGCPLPSPADPASPGTDVMHPVNKVECPASPLSGSDASTGHSSDTGFETASDVSCASQLLPGREAATTDCYQLRSSTPTYDDLSPTLSSASSQFRYSASDRKLVDLRPAESTAVTRRQQLSPEELASTELGNVAFNQLFPVSPQSQPEMEPTFGYTYEAFIATDGRSKRRKATAVSESPTVLAASRTTTCSGAKYTCAECGRQYATSSNLSRHKQTHRSLSSRYARSCPHCHKPYVSMPALAMHILTHDLKYRCPICDKAFSRPWLLRGHQRSHTGERPFGCAHCGKAFADRSNLRAHIQTHSSSKHYQCPRCGRQFALKSYLNKHLSEVGACHDISASGHVTARFETDDDRSMSTVSSST